MVGMRKAKSFLCTLFRIEIYIFADSHVLLGKYTRYYLLIFDRRFSTNVQFKIKWTIAPQLG